MEIGGGHVVPLLAVGGEILNRGKEVPQQVKRSLAGVAAADVLDTIDSKLLVPEIASVAEDIREKEERITRHKVQRELVIALSGK